MSVLDFKNLTVNQLIKKLYDSVKSFIKGMESVVQMNDKLSKNEIDELKEHLTNKLNNGEEVTDNTKLISLLDVLSKDQTIMHIIKDDAEDWILMLEAIENSINSKTTISKEEEKEIEQINTMTNSIKDFLRKE